MPVIDTYTTTSQTLDGFAELLVMPEGFIYTNFPVVITGDAFEIARVIVFGSVVTANNNSTAEALDFNGVDLNLLVTDTGNLLGPYNNGATIAASDDVEIVNQGSIQGINNLTGHGIQLSTTDASADFVIFNSGSIHGAAIGINILNATGTFELTNTGTLSGGNQAIFGGSTVSGLDFDLSNSGSILGEIRATAGNDEITNSNLIEGDMDLYSGADTITNTGTIIGDIDTGTSGDEIINAGTIIGDINMDSSNDYFENTGQGAVGGTVDAGSGTDTLIGGVNADYFEGGSNNDLIRGGAGDDVIGGGSGDDTLRAGKGDDEMFGGTGEDIIRGGDGEDEITGGTGEDTLFGGQGADTFIYETESDSPDDNSLRDIIQDFAPTEDLIDLTAFGGLAFVGNAGFSGTGAEVYVTDPNSIGRVKVFVDTDGDGTADMKIILNNTTMVTEDDFLL